MRVASGIWNPDPYLQTLVAAYEYRTGSELPLYAQKQRGFRAKSTYGHFIKDKVLIDTARVSGLDVMHTLNLLTMGVAENMDNSFVACHRA